MFKQLFVKNEAPDLMLFAIYDTKTQSYRDPVFAVNDLDLRRQYETLVKKYPDDQLVMNATDFQAFKIGEYSRKHGLINAQQHEHMFNLHELKSAVIALEKANPALLPT